MWWSRPALAVALVVAAGPVGCGFQPMYAKTSTQSDPYVEELGGIYVLGIEDRIGQQLRNALVQQLNPRGEPSHSRYQLEISLSETQESLAEQSDGKTTLGRMFLTAQFRLKTNTSQDAIFSGSSRSVVSYRFQGPRYASVATERDAERRAISDLAEDIRRQLGAYIAQRSRPAR